MQTEVISMHRSEIRDLATCADCRSELAPDRDRLRALGAPDVFPASDLGLRRALAAGGPERRRRWTMSYFSP